MANQLEMAIVQSILHLYSLRWSQRRIARELQIDRETVRRCLLRHLGTSNSAISPAGCPGSKPATFSPSPGPAADGVDGRDDGGSAGDAKPAISPAGSEPRNAGPNEAISHAGALSGDKPSDASSPRLESIVAPAVGLAVGLAGRPSLCAMLAEVIGAKLDLGFSSQRIFQDLREEHEFKGGYDSVKRYVRRLGASRPLPFRRMECDPGVELQVDFGKGAPVIQADGKRRWTHVFRAVLSHSRKGFSEATYRQTTEDFVRCLENAFWYFGGVPQTVVIDNLRAAVKHPDWYDPELNPKLEAFCRHYGTVILPTKSYTPRHKGKVERGVDYVSLAGRHPSEALENACETALSYGAYRLQTVRELIGRRAAKQASFDFLNEHSIIRPLADYSEWLRTTLAQDAAAPRGFGRHGRAIEGRSLEDEEKSPEGQAAIEARAAFHRPDPDIPCRAAPQQAPTPFLQTTPL